MLQLIRFKVPEGSALNLEDVRLFGSVDSPRAVFVAGRLVESDEPLFAVLLERPTRWRQLERATKEQREEAQVHRFMRDFEHSTGEKFAEQVTRGGEHPDFIARHSDGSTSGLECTQLVYGDRLSAWRELEVLWSGLATEPSRRFRHLRG